MPARSAGPSARCSTSSTAPSSTASSSGSCSPRAARPGLPPARRCCRGGVRAAPWRQRSASAPTSSTAGCCRGNLAGRRDQVARRPAARLVTSERNLGHALTPRSGVLERAGRRAEDVATANSQAVRARRSRACPVARTRMRVIPPGVAALPRPAAAGRVRRGDGRAAAPRQGPRDGAASLGAGAAVAPRGATLVDRRRRPGARALERRVAELGARRSAVTLRGDDGPRAVPLRRAAVPAPPRAPRGSRARCWRRSPPALPVVAPTSAAWTSCRATPSARVAGRRRARRWRRGARAARGRGRRAGSAAAAAREAAARHRPGACHAAYARLYAELLG